MFECKLVSSKTQTAFGPLCLLGYYLIEEGVLEPLCGVRIDQKTVSSTLPPRSSSTPWWVSSRAVRPSTRRTQGCVRICPSGGPSDASAWPISPPSRGP